MALIQCNECGQQISDKATTCPHCGVSINNVESVNNSSKVLKLVWKGKSAIREINMAVKVNGKLLGNYSYNSGFEVNIPITSPIMEINFYMDGMNNVIKLTLNPNENYTCVCTYSSNNFGISYELYNENGSLMKVDKLGIGMWALCFLIPIVGLIYYFVKKDEYPAKAKGALWSALLGFVINIIYIVFIQ